MASARLELKLDGVVSNGTWSNPSGNTVSLYVPIESEADLHPGFIQPVGGKVSTDAQFDYLVNLQIWRLIEDVSGGAWRKFLDTTTRQYYLPEWTTSGPLAWTLDPNHPVLCGAGTALIATTTYAFEQFYNWKSAVYGLDTKGSKLYKEGASPFGWTDQAIGLTSVPTEIHANKDSTALIVGQTTGQARISNSSGAGWTAWSPGGRADPAQHFCMFGSNDLYYSSGQQLLQASNVTGYVRKTIGFPQTNINKLIWWSSKILVFKPEGVFAFDPASKSTEQIFSSPDLNVNNGKAAVFHRGNVYFNAGEHWYIFDGTPPRPADFLEVDGFGARPVDLGTVIGAWSDGMQLYLAVKVTTATTYDVYIVIWSGRTGGYHPIFVQSVLLASYPASYEPRALYLDNNRLRYSLGNDITGYLCTDGVSPLSNQAASIPFTRNVAISTGWFDAGRDAVTKLFRNYLVSQDDRGTTGSVLLSYKEWGETSWTDLPSATAAGPQDNVTCTPTPRGLTQIGFMTTKVNTKITLQNSSSTPYNAWWLSNLHVVGQAQYSAAYQLNFAALLSGDGNNPITNPGNSRTYPSQMTQDALAGAISQPGALTLTDIYGNSYKGR